MNPPLTGRRAGTANGRPPRLAGWLSLAAAPTFLVMAGLAATSQGSVPDLLCMAPDASPLAGMVPMYLLMSVFHAAPWLTLLAGRRSGIGRSERCRPYTGSGDAPA